MAMSWLAGRLKQIMGKDSQAPLVFPYGETAGLIGEAVAEYIPEHMIEGNTVFEISMLMTRRPHQLSQQENVKLTMRIDDNLNVQMMEYPESAKVM